MTYGTFIVVVGLSVSETADLLGSHTGLQRWSETEQTSSEQQLLRLG